MHELVVAWVVVAVAAAMVTVIGAEVAGLMWVAAVTADVVGVAGAVIACYLAFGVVWVVVVAVGGLRLLWPCYWGRNRFHLAAIWLGFGGVSS